MCIRDSYRTIPIILLSGAFSLQDLKIKLPYDFDLLLLKPFNPGELKANIKSLLD